MAPLDRDAFILKMNKLKRAYMACLVDWSAELERYAQNQGRWKLEDTNNMQILVHKLTGTGATYGYSNITDAARSLEYKLAYANVGFKVGVENPNTNPLIVAELRGLIRVCNDILRQNEVARMEEAMYGSEIDDLINTPANNPHNKTILVVDDHEIIRNTLEAALQEAGFNTLLANDGDDALMIMQKKTPDLIILDRVMPHLDGLTLLKTMRKMDGLKNVPVIFLTALYNPTDILEAEKLGAVDYVAKPFDVDEFTLRCIKTLSTPRKK